MPKLYQGICAIHDMSGFGHIGRLKGVQHYSDRALLLPVDIAVIHDGNGDME